ncbi:unnamed protein product, partial [Rotaria sordida]
SSGTSKWDSQLVHPN